MSESVLRLAPHEIPLRRRIDMDEKPLLFEANCFGRIREFVGQSISEDGYDNAFFFQLCDEPQRGSFVYSANENAAQFYKASSWASIETVEEFKKCVESNLWGRYLVLDESLNLATANNGCNTLFLNWNGLGMFHPDGGSFARFRWNQPCLAEIWNLPVSELLSQFIIRVQEPESEPQFAIWWAKLSDAEHFDLIFPLGRGTHGEWKNVYHLLLLAFISPVNVSDANSVFCFAFDGDFKANIYYRLANNTYQLVESLPLQKLSRWLHDYFAPKRNDELCMHYLCARQWASSDALCEVRIDQPTQHERLEALLQLRDWLSDKAAPAEIDALLRAD